MNRIARLFATAGLAWGVGGCGCDDLSDLAVKGTAGETRSALTRALRDFDRWTTVDVCLSSARVANVKHDGGRYDSVARSVHVDPDAATPYHYATHELCHAADIQNGLSDGQPDVFIGASDAPQRWSERRTAREGFAEVCALGAPSIRLATALSCAENDVSPAWWGVRDALYFDRVREDAIGHVDLLEDASWAPPGAGSAEDLELRQCRVDASGDLAVILASQEMDRLWIGLVDPRTGTSVGREPDWDVFTEDIPVVDGPEGWLSLWGIETDELVVLWAYMDRPLEPIIDRLLFQVGSRWGVIDRCPAPTGECAFELDGQIWWGHVRDGAFRWGPVRYVP